MKAMVAAKIFFTILLTGLAVGCAVTDRKSGEPTLAQELTYAQEFESIVEIIRERGYRQVDFDKRDSKDVILYLLHALDPAYLVLKKQDVEHLQTKYFKDIASEKKRYSALVMVIEEFSMYASMVMERSVLEHLAVEPDWTSDHIDATYDYWASTDSALSIRWENVVYGDASYYHHDGYNWTDIHQMLLKSYSMILNHGMFLSDGEKFVLAANAALELVDSESMYWESTESMDQYSLSTEGLGLIPGWIGGSLKVEKIIAGGPADLDGKTYQGDQIVAIAEEGQEFVSTSGLTLQQVTRLLRGETGTMVHLRLRRDNLPIDVAIARGSLETHSQRISHRVDELTLDGKRYALGILTVPAFYVDFQAMRRKEPNYLSAARDLEQSLDTLQALPVDGVVIDIRGNSGGSLQEGNLVANLFIESGPVFQILHGRKKKVFRDGKRNKSDYYDAPLVVLVDQLSAGSSEILAGMIQDYSGGVVVGHQTYGHGVVQSMIPMSEGQIRLTESELFRVTGESYQINGVTPDIALQVSNRPLLERVGQKNERNPILPGKILPVKTRNYNKAPPELLKTLNLLHLERVVSDPLLKTADHVGQEADTELYEAKNIAIDYIRALKSDRHQRE